MWSAVDSGTTPAPVAWSNKMGRVIASGGIHFDLHTGRIYM